MAIAIPPAFQVTHVGLIHSNPSVTFTRPADTVPYSVGDLVANSTIAGSVAVPSTVSARVEGGSVEVSRVKLQKSTTGISNASFRVHFFSALPTSTTGDNAVFTITGASSYLGSVDVVLNQVFTDGAVGFTDITMKSIKARLPMGNLLYVLVEARAAYNPGSAEIFTISMDLILG
jgi:hypothetical protein